VTKGLPILIEAFKQFSHPRAELIIVGSTATRGMRRYMAEQMTDHRIKMSPGDPLPALRQASVYVHPSFQDGFGYAPMEALACGVPVIVTEDTGMKEHVNEGVNGYVVPTGDVDALVQRLEHIAKHPLRFTP
jgi:glycosyltransferase involved in cell wall biosynthesis